MKNIVILIAALVAILLTGCGAKAPKPFLIIERESSVVSLGSYNDDIDKVSPVQNLAIQMKRAAKVLKKNGYTTFKLDMIHNIPHIITNFDDLVKYSFPENEGNEASSWTAGSTSLGDKGNFKISRNTSNNQVYLEIYAADNVMTAGTWSIKDVLENKNLNLLIKNAKVEGTDIRFYKDLIVSGTLKAKDKEFSTKNTYKSLKDKLEKESFVDNLD